MAYKKRTLIVLDVYVKTVCLDEIMSPPVESN